MRFLHAADLHLDTPVAKLRTYPDEVARVLRDASLDAFDRLVQTALDKRVAACLFAGDVYDGADRGTRAQLRFRDGLQRLSDAGIRSFIVHGNHDPVTEGWTAVNRWPELVTIFGPGAVQSDTFEVDGLSVTVHGVSYATRNETENLALRFPTAVGPGVHIGLLHTQVGARNDVRSYAPCTLEDLRRSPMDYWALGHVHRRETLAGPAPWIAYPGNIQARRPSAFDAMPKGAVMVEVLPSGDVLEPAFVPLDVVRFALPEVPIDGLADIGELLDRLQAIADGLVRAADGRSVIVHPTLTGRGPLHHELARGTEELHTQLGGVDRQPFLWWDHFVVATSPDVDLDRAAAADDLVGAVLRDLASVTADDLASLLAELPSEAATAFAAGHIPGGSIESIGSVESVESVDPIVRRSWILAHDALVGGGS